MIDTLKLILLERNIVATSKVEKAGDAFLAPLRFALGGKDHAYFTDYDCFLNYDSYFHTRFEIAYDNDKSSWRKLKRVGAFIPGVPLALIGSVVKGVSFWNNSTRMGYLDSTKANEKIHLTSKENLFEILKACTPHAGWAAIGQFKDLLTQDQKFELTKLITSKYERSLINHYREFDLKPEQNYEILKRLAPKYPCLVADQINWRNLNEKHKENNLRSMKLSEEHRKELLLLVSIASGLVNLPSHHIEKLFKLEKLSKPFYELICNLHSSNPDVHFNSNPNRTFSYIPELEKSINQELPTTRVEDIIKGLKQFKNPDLLRKIMLQIISAVFIWSRILSPEERSWIDKEELLLSLSCFKATDLSLYLIHAAAQIAKQEILQYKFTQMPLKLEEKHPAAKLLRIPLVVLESSGVDFQTIRELLKEMDALPGITDLKLMNLMEALTALSSNTTLSSQEKAAVLAAMAEGPLLKRLQEVSMIIGFGEVSCLKDLSEGLSALSQKVFQELLPTKEVSLPEDFSERYMLVFGAYRNPDAPKIYAGTLKQLRNPDVMTCLGDHIASVLNGTYLKRRYDTANNPHLQKIPKITLEKWQENSQVLLEELLVERVKKAAEEETPFQWLYQKLIVDKHMKLEELPFVVKYLETEEPEVRENLRAELSQQLQAEAKKGKTHRSPEVMKALSLQKKLLDLARSNKRENFLQLLQEIYKLGLLEPCEFSQDIEGQITKLNTKEDLAAVYTVHETDDPEDILACGSEVNNSCQRINGSAAHNQGLLGYLRHGQTRLIAIKAKDGSIVARSLIRLLWDGTRPVLFLERLYSNSPDARFSQAIQAVATRTALRLNCPLTTLSDHATEALPCPKALECFGGPAPFEYIDGATGVCSKGKFVIPASPNLVLLHSGEAS